MITLHEVSKSYGTHGVLTGVTADVRPGDVTLVVGANGCGKTTTLRLIAGVSSADGGDIYVADRNVRTDRIRAQAMLSYLPQSPRFHAQLTAHDILAFYAGIRDIPPQRVTAVADRWGLTKMLAVRTGRLSGGMRQRLALAVLFLPDAPVLVLDEPGLSLDPDWRRFLQSELRTAARNGRTVLVSTHLMGEWDQRADRCLVLEGGRVSRELLPDRLLEAFPFSAPRPVAAAVG